MRNDFSYKIKRIILEQSRRAGVGHIGSALSVADIISALYDKVLNIPSPEDEDRDRFILSKGHAALALYGAFFLKGYITEKELNTYCADGSVFGTHPERFARGVDFATGSLGHGLSMGAGAALAARLQNSSRRAFVLLSDGECDEGSVWEAAMFAAQHRLSNLIAIIDLNGQQAFGYTRDVLDLSPMREKWKAFGWDVKEANGHDVSRITKIIGNMRVTSGRPHVLIARTICGKGVSFMENQIKWHYWPMSDDEYRQAMSDIEKDR